MEKSVPEAGSAVRTDPKGSVPAALSVFVGKYRRSWSRIPIDLHPNPGKTDNRQKAERHDPDGHDDFDQREPSGFSDKTGCRIRGWHYLVTRVLPVRPEMMTAAILFVEPLSAASWN